MGDYKSNLLDDSIPFAIHTALRVALTLLQAVKQEPEGMERDGVIMEVYEPTKWCAGIVRVLKPSGILRLFVDLTQLTKPVRRERFAMSTVDDTLGRLSGEALRPKSDVRYGFYEIRLEPESNP